ncbi:hypothetical protein GGU10DRAFT_268764, partial [Lentinula aff. detonsa]
SRNHPALKYNDLNVEARRTVWQNFMSRLGVDQTSMSRKDKNVMNGKQIKNAVKTAESLAGFHNEKVGRKTVETTVLDIQREFSGEMNYLER